MDPFTEESPEALMHNARYLLNVLAGDAPYGVSKFNVLYAAAKLGRKLGAYKLARHSYDQLRKKKVQRPTPRPACRCGVALT